MKGHVLIVDDVHDQCDLLATLASRLAYRVTSTASPAEALALAAVGPFDAILTDLGTSIMSGTELCSRIMATRVDVPVIVVTGLRSTELAIASVRAGAYDFLSKPVDSNVLGITLQRAVQHHRLCEEVTRLREQMPDAQMAGWKKVRAHKPEKIELAVEDSNEILTLDELSRRYILRALRIVGGNRSRAAELLGLDRRTLYRRMEKYQRVSAEGGSAHAGLGS